MSAARESDERFRHLADAVPIFLWVSGPDGKAAWFNRAWLAFVGRTLEQEIGDGWMHDVHPEDLPQAREIYARAFARREPFAMESRLRRRDGEYRSVFVNGVPVETPDGDFGGYVGTCLDVTDQKRASSAQAYLAAIIESADDAIVSKDLDGIIQSCNASAERMFGYPAAELIGRSVRILIPPDRQGEEDEILARVRRGERLEHFETIRMRKDGGLRDISLTVSPVRDARGAIVGVSKIARDITAQKQAAADLAAQQAWFRITLASIGDAVIASDFRGQVTFMNASAERLTGWSSADAIGRQLQEVFHIINEKTRHRVDNPAMLVMRLGRVVGLANHTVLVGRDGTEHPIADSAAPIRDPEGRILGVVLVFRDVSDQRLAEEAIAEQREWLETTLESIGDAVIATDVQGRIVFMNPVAEYLTGWRAAPAQGRPCSDVFRLVDEHTRRPVDDPVSRVLADGGVTGLVGHTLLLRADGTERPIDESGAPIRNRSGRTIGVVLVFRDVSDRRRMELDRQSAEAERDRLLDAERAARAEAERASRVKDDFVAMVSHELRTPLNAILGWTQLMMRGRQDAATLERGLDVIARNTRLQAQLIADLLDISRIVSGKLQLEIQSVDLYSVVADAVETVRHEADGKGIGIHEVLDRDTGFVAGDPARLQQIVWNLLSNAVKFTPSGGRIEVTLRPSGERAEIAVADNGAGIRRDVLPHVFDRFHQADRSITRRFGGLGLGLSIVRHLTELHGGTVRAESPGEGGGATFTIALPASAAAAADAGSRPSTSPEAYKAVSLDGMRILIVEDEPDTREFLRRLLEGHGATVSMAGSAQEALDMFENHPPDILISDIGLPDVDGYDLMHRIRQSTVARGNTIPAIALTAYARAEDRTRALRAGYHAHLAKPVEPNELLVTIASFSDLVGRDRKGV